MRILGIDVETTGLDCTTDRITEIGAVLLDWNSGIPLQVLSALVNPRIPIPAEVVKLTGITDEMVESFSREEQDVLVELGQMAIHADYFMAHKASFDRGFIEVAMQRQALGGDAKPWLCSMEDIKYPSEITTRNLRYLAAEMGFVNPFAHRAIFDVLTMFKVAEQFDIEDIIKRSQEPTIYVQAHVTFQENQYAKDKSFRWCAPKKIWWKALKLSDYDAERGDYAFRSTILDGQPE